MDPEETRLEALRMAFDLLSMHGAPFAAIDALTVADVFVGYIQTGEHPTRREQPTVN